MSPGTGLVNILLKHYYVVIINIFQVSYSLAYLDTLFANGTCFIQHSNTYKQSCCSFINSGNIKQTYVKHATSKALLILCCRSNMCVACSLPALESTLHIFSLRHNNVYEKANVTKQLLILFVCLFVCLVVCIYIFQR